MQKVRQAEPHEVDSRWERWNWFACLGLLFPACILCVWVLVNRVAFDHYSIWDDEGYFLLILKRFFSTGGLYVMTDSQFGPFFTLAESSLHRLFHVPVDLDGGRILTVSYILGSAILLSVFVGRLTRKLAVALACFVLSVMATAPILGEPGHPQGLIAVLASISLCASLLVGNRHENTGLILLGAVTAALVLTKINVGLFFCFALAFPLILMQLKGNFRSLILGLFVACSFCLAPVLMSAYLRGWAAPFCVYMLISFAALYIGAFQSGAPNALRPGQIAYPILGFIATAMPILVWAVLTGSTVSSLVSGILLRPLRYPRLFYAEFAIPKSRLLLLLLPVLGLSVIPRARRKFPNFGRWLAASKVAIALISAVSFVWNADSSMFYSLPAMFYSLPLLPLLLLPSSEVSWDVGDIFPRLFLVSLLEFESLQAYPVLGTHQNALAFSGAWVCLLLHDGWSALVGLYPETGPRASLVRSPAILGLLCLILATPVFFFYLFMAPAQSGNIAVRHRQIIWRWVTGQSPPPRSPHLDLPGARLLRMPAAEASIYRRLAEVLHANCDTLFTMPGMGSLNEWSETPPPNGYNLTCWMGRFTTQEQEDIRTNLEHAERPCVVYSPELVRFWIRPQVHFDPNAPMFAYVLQDTKTVFTAGGYQVRVPVWTAGRQLHWLHASDEFAPQTHGP